MGISIDSKEDKSIYNGLAHAVMLQEEEDAREWFNKGTDAANAGNNKEAIRCYNRCIRLNPKSFKAMNNKGVCMQRMGKIKEGLKLIEKALQLDPKNRLMNRNKKRITEMIKQERKET
jgi:tetratricopeptide (TPR) repeat protein